MQWHRQLFALLGAELIDYYNYTGDAVTLGGYITNATAKLDKAYAIYGTNPSLRFYGWDERLGADLKIRTAGVGESLSNALDQGLERVRGRHRRVWPYGSSGQIQRLCERKNRRFASGQGLVSRFWTACLCGCR